MTSVRSAGELATPRKRRHLLYIIAVVVILLGSLLYVWHVRSASDRLTPPKGVTDLRTFLLQMPAPDRAYELSVGDAHFVELVGPLLHVSTFPSGPPAYVFDESQQLVDWTADQGDDPDYVSQWHTSVRRELTDEEKKDLFGTK